MHPAVVTGLAGAGILAGSVAGAWRPEIPARERTVFRAVNGLPGRLYWPLWVPMQLGNLVVGTLAGLAVALVDRDGRLAVAVLLAAVLKLVAERGCCDGGCAAGRGRPPTTLRRPLRCGRHPRRVIVGRRDRRRGRGQ